MAIAFAWIVAVVSLTFLVWSHWQYVLDAQQTREYHCYKHLLDLDEAVPLIVPHARGIEIKAIGFGWVVYFDTGWRKLIPRHRRRMERNVRRYMKHLAEAMPPKRRPRHVAVSAS